MAFLLKEVFPLKKWLAFTLAALLVLGPVTARAEEDQEPGASPEEGIMLLTAPDPDPVVLPFEDVHETDWFYGNVRACYEDAIMLGTAPTLFSPKTILREEEAATLAARLLAMQKGETVPAAEPGELWYAPVLRYLTGLGLNITAGVQCTRFRFLTMLGSVLDDMLLEPVYTVDSLPDTADETVLRFYRSGILDGMDPYGTFAPSRILTRAEAATMVSRILRPELRVVVAPLDYSPFRAAGAAPSTAFFSNGITAEQYLKEVNSRIAFLEYVCDYNDIEFNWLNTYGPYAKQTFLEYVTDGAFTALGVTESMGSRAYSQFIAVGGIPVYYSRLIDLRDGEPLLADAVTPAAAR